MLFAPWINKIESNSNALQCSSLTWKNISIVYGNIYPAYKLVIFQDTVPLLYLAILSSKMWLPWKQVSISKFWNLDRAFRHGNDKEKCSSGCYCCCCQPFLTTFLSFWPALMCKTFCPLLTRKQLFFFFLEDTFAWNKSLDCINLPRTLVDVLTYHFCRFRKINSSASFSTTKVIFSSAMDVAWKEINCLRIFPEFRMK